MWLCKTRIRWKSKILLYQYRYFNCIHKKDDVYKVITEDVEARFDTSNYELDRQLQKNKKVKKSLD